MKRWLLVLILIYSTIICTQAQSTFPAAWIGEWKGTLHWYSNGKSEPKKVDMQLNIKPVADSVGVYTWHLVYGKATEDSRPYQLRLVDSAKKQWVIDEMNGILIDQYFVGTKFSGAFSVGKSVILNTYWIENNELHVEFYSHPLEPARTSGNGTDDIPFVKAYEIRSYQKAVLTRR